MLYKSRCFYVFVPSTAVVLAICARQLKQTDAQRLIRRHIHRHTGRQILRNAGKHTELERRTFGLEAELALVVNKTKNRER